MNEHTDSDLQAELAALRQRLSNLEAEHEELRRQATRARPPAFYRKFLRSVLPVALFLAVGGLLYAVDSLLIDEQGNTTFVGNVGIRTKPSQKTLDVNGSLNVASDSTLNGNTTVKGTLTTEKNVGIGTSGNTPDLPLVVGAPTGGPKIAINDIKTARWALGSGNYMLHIANDFPGPSWTDRLVINKEGNVGIGTGTAEPTARLSVNGSIAATGNVTCASANIRQEDWKPVGPTGFTPFQNKWENYLNPANKDPYNVYNTAGFFKDSMGIVHLRGMVMNGVDATIFTLPAGYRPIARELFACLSANNVGRVDVLKTGEVALQQGTAKVWVSLDGLTFRAGSN